MKRNIVLIFVFCLVLVMGGAGCEQKDSSPRIAVVDTEKVFKNSKNAKEAMAYIEALNNDFTKRIGEMQAGLSADQDNTELLTTLQSEFMGLQSEFERVQTETADKLNKQFEAAIEEYREKNKIEVVLPVQMVISSKSEADITDAVIAIMDAKPVDLPASTLKQDAAKSAPEEGQAESATPPDEGSEPAPAAEEQVK